jgi:hypothetical protein
MIDPLARTHLVELYCRTRLVGPAFGDGCWGYWANPNFQPEGPPVKRVCGTQLGSTLGNLTWGTTPVNQPRHPSGGPTWGTPHGEPIRAPTLRELLRGRPVLTRLPDHPWWTRKGYVNAESRRGHPWLTTAGEPPLGHTLCDTNWGTTYWETASANKIPGPTSEDKRRLTHFDGTTVASPRGSHLVEPLR